MECQIRGGITIFNSTLRTGLLCLLAFVLAGCGGGPDDAAASVAPIDFSSEAPATTATDPAPTSSDPATTATDPVAADDLVATAESLVAALQRYDGEAAAAVMHPDATILHFGFWPRTVEEYPSLVAWTEIVEWVWEQPACVLVDGMAVEVSCTAMVSNSWSRALDVGAAEATMSFVFEDGDLIQLEARRDLDWQRMTFGAFRGWLEANHADDMETIFRFDENGDLTGGPATDAAALDLFRTRSSEFVESVLDEG